MEENKANKTSLHTLLVHFDLRLHPKQLSRWRGAVAEDAGWNKDAFHNHVSMEVGPS